MLMRRLLIVSIIFFSINSRAEADAKQCQALSDFDTIAKTITENFYDKTFKGLDWPKRIEFYRGKVLCSFQERQISSVINELLSELQTSHTGIYIKDDLKYWGLKSVFARDLSKYKVPFSGIWPVQISGDWYAQFVLQSSSASKAKVRAGDKLLTIDGKHFEPLGFSAVQKYALSFTSDGVAKKIVRLAPESLSIQQYFLNAAKSSEAILRSGDKKIGYFHLWCGTDDAFLDAMNAALMRFKAAKVNGVIIDLRDGFGGAYPEYLSLLTTDSFLKATPKAFIINGGVTSGKEWISAIIKRDKIGRLVGTKTAGAFMSGAPFDLLNGRYFLYLAVKEFKPPGIPIIEGRGVEPDDLVEPCEMLCKGKDVQLEKAIEEIAGDNQYPLVIQLDITRYCML